MIWGRHLEIIVFRGLAAATVLLIVIGLIAVDVTGDAESSSGERWFTSVLLDAKIRSSRARRLSPLTQADENLERGSELYQQQCGFCHGVARDRMAPLARSFSPRPPQFVIKAAQGPTWKDAYVIQHGIRWTAMPAFRSLSEADAWRLALYVEGESNPNGRQ